MSMTTPGAGPLRRAVEGRSAVTLVWLSAQRRWLVGVVPAVLLVGLVLARGPLALLPGLLLLTLVGWLAYLSWPRLDPGLRLLRVLVLLALALVTAVQVRR